MKPPMMTTFMKHSEIRQAHATLRFHVYNKFDEWKIDHSKRSCHLKWLLRGENYYFTTSELLTEEEVNICHALLGPHGFAVYKMLLTRKEASNG